MVNTKELILKTKPFAEENRKKSWILFVNVLFLCTITIAGTTIKQPLYLRFVFSVVLGLLLVRIFIFYHDFHHKAIFKKSKLAKLILNIYGILVLTPPEAWSSTHNYHHDNNCKFEKMSLDLFNISFGYFFTMTKTQYQESSRRIRLRYRMVRNPLIIFLSYLPIFLLGMCLVPFLKQPGRHFLSLIAILLHGAMIYGLSLLGWDYVIFSLVLPLWCTLVLGSYFFYIQHNYPSVKLKTNDQWDYGFAAVNSSSFMDVNKLLHWFSGNIGYHHVHHANSSIPFYRLPEAMAAIPELQNPGRTNLAPFNVLSCLRLKLWDVERDKMVGF